MTTPADSIEPSAPPLFQDRSFWGMTVTQLLGAFNDNVFKQLVLLLCIDLSNKYPDGPEYQSIALGIFAISFVAFSGFAGFLSDRWSKQKLIVGCKVLEIVVMLAGVLLFLTITVLSKQLIYGLYCVLFFMSVQSALFGPAKYGVLPELFKEGDLPQANGMIQMTTFLAIIFGTAVAGFGMDIAETSGAISLWHISLFCVVIAVIGTLTSLCIRRTAIAHPGLPFRASSLFINAETVKFLKQDRQLLNVLFVSSLFWFLGGIVLPSVNEYGENQLQVGKFHTSLLATCMGIGIAAGCLLSGKLSKHRVNFKLVTAGVWGLAVGFVLLAVAGGFQQQLNTFSMFAGKITGPEFVSGLILVQLGLSAGLFVVPLQVFMQSRAPEDQKGRMIGAMNLVNWLGILAAALFHGLFMTGLRHINAANFFASEIPMSVIFAAAGLIVLPVAIFYRPVDVQGVE